MEPKFGMTGVVEGNEEEYDPDEPRLGRRDSEPHSFEVSTLKDILTSNFPDSRTLWDLHHYFKAPKKFSKKRIDIKFDISFFLGWKMDKFLSSFDSELFNNKVPILGINILSRRTWRADIGENVDICKLIGLKYYIVYAAYHVASDFYQPPFLRVYRLVDNAYISEDLKEVAIREDGTINSSAIVDIGPEIPFRIGLIEKKNMVFDDESMFHLLVFHKSRDEMLLGTAEQEKQRAEQEKQRAEQEKLRAEQEKQRAEQEKQRAESLEQEIQNLKQQLETLKKRQ